MAGKYNVCLDIGGTKVLGAIFNDQNEIIYRLKKSTKENGDDVVNVEQIIINTVAEMMKEAKLKKSDINAISAGAPGVIDSDTGIVFFSPNLPWRNYDIRTPIEKKFGTKFYIGNDVNCGVLGEYKYGVAQGYKNVIGIFPGTGMGGGIIINGELYTGTGFKAGEIGHMVLDPEGPLCGCGQCGCLEAFSSKKGMSAYIVQQVARGRESFLGDKIENGVFRSKYLKKALKMNDKVAMEAVERSCHYMAVASGSLINIFSPDLIVYGGGIMEACGEIFLEKILDEVDKYCMPSIRPTVELKRAGLGDDSVLYGALAMITDSDKKKAQ
ncbi:MAG: ROK family protein [Lachnospiraceae bacterium]|nr:ROK family protein [Lachnospiraceae bacterium]